MSLRILFADDSVTAQNMGKKILTEAGYEVIAVSNGAAAVKKIAEQKPDIIILDVYMPGYSGLEVCEKVRSNIATIKTPVLLTVGKMEPYKPEDANRVRADGVIIKPFEASDLLAIIKKFEERIKAMPAPAVIAPPPVRKVDLYPEPENPEPVRAKVMQSTVEVPDHMASSSAFSDLLGGESGYPTPHFVAPPSSAPAADETARLSAVPDYDVPASWRPEAPSEPDVMAAPESAILPVTAAPTVTDFPAVADVSEPEPEPEAMPEPISESETSHVAEISVDAASSPIGDVPEAVTARPIQIPVYQDSTPAPAEFMPTAAAPIGDIDVPREPALQESAEEITRSTVADAREADLMPTSHAANDAAGAPVSAHVRAPMHVAEMSVGAPIESPAADFPSIDVHAASPIIDRHANETAVGTSSLETSHVADAAPIEASAPLPPLTNDDFEARVAAAMAAYSHGQPTSPGPADNGKNGLSEMPPSMVSETAAPIGVPAPDMEAAPNHQPSAPANAEPEPQLQEINAEPIHEAAIPAPSPVGPAMAGSATAEAVAARVEAELPAAATAIAEAAEAGGAEHHNIAQVVHRVMERMKGDLVEEIVRELKAKK